MLAIRGCRRQLIHQANAKMIPGLELQSHSAIWRRGTRIGRTAIIYSRGAGTYLVYPGDVVAAGKLDRLWLRHHQQVQRGSRATAGEDGHLLHRVSLRMEKCGVREKRCG
jgi:hypothetical protein